MEYDFAKKVDRNYRCGPRSQLLAKRPQIDEPGEKGDQESDRDQKSYRIEVLDQALGKWDCDRESDQIVDQTHDRKIDSRPVSG